MVVSPLDAGLVVALDTGEAGLVRLVTIEARQRQSLSCRLDRAILRDFIIVERQAGSLFNTAPAGFFPSYGEKYRVR